MFKCFKDLIRKNNFIYIKRFHKHNVKWKYKKEPTCNVILFFIHKYFKKSSFLYFLFLTRFENAIRKFSAPAETSKRFSHREQSETVFERSKLGRPRRDSNSGHCRSPSREFLHDFLKSFHFPP
jgi:hypothetical protein